MVDGTTHSQSPLWIAQDERRWTHVRVDVALLKDPELGAVELAVYMGLAAHAELQSGRTFPSQSTLASYAGVSERTVRRALERLDALRYIRIVRQPGRASAYNLLPPPQTPDTGSGVGVVPPGTPRTQVPGSPDTGSGAPDTGSDEQEPTNKNHLTNTPAAPAESEPFERFWEHYPRKAGKGQARRAWKTAVKKLDAEMLIEAAVLFHDLCRARETRYIPHPSTWLNGERWLDDVEKPGPDGVTYDSPAPRGIFVNGVWQ